MPQPQPSSSALATGVQRSATRRARVSAAGQALWPLMWCVAAGVVVREAVVVDGAVVQREAPSLRRRRRVEHVGHAFALVVVGIAVVAGRGHRCHACVVLVQGGDVQASLISGADSAV